MENLLEEKPDKISTFDIQDIAEIVNKNIGFFRPGFRNINVEVQGAPYIPIEARRVRKAMYSLLDSYYNIWCDLPVYEREAKFHINFLRIHPFEDGNGRTSRVIMNYNLCKNNKAPIIIDKEDRQTYFDFIDYNREKKLAEYIEYQSNKELQIMLELYKNIVGDENIEKSINEDKENIKIYSIIRSK